MLKSGLVSITFRKLNVYEIVELVKESGLDAIEWGGDVHVTHGDVQKASEVSELCRKNNIECPSYGSYYRAGEGEDIDPPFKDVLDCAKTLGCSTIRVWAGGKGSRDADLGYFKKVSDDLQRICRMADEEGMSISLEFHKNTLTDDADAEKRLIENVSANNLYTYWQPPVERPYGQNIREIEMLKDKISNVHVFTWEGTDRQELEKGYDEWFDYISAIDDERTHYCMVEFVKDDSTEQFKDDAAALKRLLNDYKTAGI